ncbi:MAG: ThuA domain-containing protein [Anaerolineae bacterium]|nr:ThuA domain-containing protein [Anaerolineae bacterium]
MARKALIVWGGWLGHEPEQIARVFERTLSDEGFDVEVSDTLASFEDVDKLNDLHLIVPLWTMGEISREQVAGVTAAVANGTGIAGCHGGMCDSFRTSVEWQFMTGGNWVSHPGGDGVEYEVNIVQSSSPLVAGISDFTVRSEQYYLHVDPAVEVLATTRFPTVTWYHAANGSVDMPVVWTKRWGLGRVYYNSLGHHADIFDIPEALELMRRGFLWAAAGKDVAIWEGLDSSIYSSDRKMF